jgi:hypothetical protein
LLYHVGSVNDKSYINTKISIMNEQMKLAQMDILIMQMPVQQMRNVPQLVAPGIAMESPQPLCINRRAQHPQTGFTVPTAYNNRRRGLGMESPPGRPEKNYYCVRT